MEMKIPVVKIGNSKGVRLSKDIIKQYDIADEVELILEDEGIMLKPVANPRANWPEQFKQAQALYGEDHLLIDDVFEDEEFEEWK